MNNNLPDNKDKLNLISDEEIELFKEYLTSGEWDLLIDNYNVLIFRRKRNIND